MDHTAASASGASGERPAPSGASGVRPASDLTIDELARRAGMTVRNVRAHQSRGLLPPPEVRGRTGYYGADHLARLELIKELQADGFNLEAIRRLIEASGGHTSDVLRFTRSVRSAFEDEEPEIVGLDELAARFGDERDRELLERALRLGVLRPLGEGRFEERSPRLARAGDELRRLGVPAKRTVELLEELHQHADAFARAYIELFLDEIWRPFEAAGRPPERWREVEQALERLRPLAAETLLALFGLVMADRVEEAVEREIRAAAGEER
ncbi:MAG TPA: MerR family transcriptional regulator [Solirubrobacteraceae bacterium]|nr:MerR family transcriptional regulator [Solirubrobacteraceae bacterium]